MKARMPAHKSMHVSMRAPSDWTSVVTFALNGERVELVNPDPQLKLVTYLREHAGLCGTKLSCGEGGCGACTVVLSHRPLDPVVPRALHTATCDDGTAAAPALVHRAVNACLFPVCALDGIAVTTVEGIGSTATGLHDVQRRLADSNGTQCGFCTPGWVMNMYELVQQQESSSEKLTRRAVEDHFDGNLCRCTGYRPILEAFHSFAADSRHKDINASSLLLAYDDESTDAGPEPAPLPLSSAVDASAHSSTRGKALLDAVRACEHYDDWLLVDAADVADGRSAICDAKCSHAGTDACQTYLDLEDLIPQRQSPSQQEHPPLQDSTALKRCEAPVPDFILHFEPRALKLMDTSASTTWYRPLSLAQLFDAIHDSSSSSSSHALEDVAFVGGRTAHGVSKYYNGTAPYNRPDDAPVQIELNYVADLKVLKVLEEDGHAVVGAAVTIATLLQFLKMYDGAGSDALTELSTLVARIANNQVRNAGTWAGNLSLCRQYPTFVSDLAVGLMGIGATLTIMTAMQETVAHVRIDDYLRKPATEFALIVSMTLPLFSTARALSASGIRVHRHELFRCYKVAQRAQNAHSHVNCAIWLRLRADAAAPVVTNARVVFGGVCKTPARFALTEKLLTDKSVTGATVAAAVAELERDVDAIGASDAFGSQSFRLATMKSLLYKTLVAAITNGDDASALVDPTVASAPDRLERAVSSGTQAFKPSSSTGPVSQPIQKIGAKWQVTGEAAYVADKELPSRALYGAILYSDTALGKLLAIDDGGHARALAGVVDILTAADIPGANDVSGGANDEPLFVPIGGIVRCVGAPLGVIVATSQAIAEQAVALCAIKYGAVPLKDRWNNQTEPIVNIDMAMRAQTLGQAEPIVMGDANASANVDASPRQLSGELFLGAQKHFYMEPQVATVSVETDGNVLQIESSSQFPVFLQQNVASVLALPLHAVNVTVQRVGGGFGGKLTRCVINAAAAALAAQKHRRTVRVLNDRTTDFQLVGGRENMKGTYRVGFDNDGYVHALDLALHVDCGYAVWDSVGSAFMAVNWSDSAYRIPSFRCQAFLYLTNTQTCTSHRAPGVPQALVLVEAALHHVATVLELPMAWVQARNLYREGDATPYGQVLTEVRLRDVWDRLLVSSRMAEREAANARFNSNNKWKKRGVAVTPTKYGMTYSGRRDGSKVDVFAADGSVAITHGGCEIGQVRVLTFDGDDDDKLRVLTVRLCVTGPTRASTRKLRRRVRTRSAFRSSSCLCARRRPTRRRTARRRAARARPSRSSSRFCTYERCDGDVLVHLDLL